MSIYATLWEIALPRRYHFDEEFIKVFAQAVPAHIGHPSSYPEGDPYADFLPPVVMEYDPETGEAPFDRAVLIIREDRAEKVGQRYTDPILVLTGEEYARSTFDELIHRIERAMGWDESIVGFKFLPSGEKQLVRKEDHPVLKRRR
ncbi:MAG TPA: hypothetical protein VEL76_13825 [Gemmataceae bacterium]|nr:hypothetical protein [Gemmataceae bacterium]